MNPYPTSVEREFEAFAEEGLLATCWEEFLTGSDSTLDVFGPRALELVGEARMAALDHPGLDAVSLAARVAMEDLQRSANAAVRRGRLPMLDEVERWTELDPWWTGDPDLPRGVRNAIRRAEEAVRRLLEDRNRKLLPRAVRDKLDERVVKHYQDAVTQRWWQDHPGPRACYAYGYID